MRIACIAYREWAINIYKEIQKSFDNTYEILLITSNFETHEKEISNFNPDIILWYGWSNIISNRFINNYFSVMLHPSPLPKYRGGSPIQNQIINGEERSAVTLFKMNNKIDEGDIIFQKEFSLTGELDSIFKRIIKTGIELTKEMIYNFNSLNFIRQEESQATFFSRRKPEQSEITLEELKNSTSLQLYNKIRALQDPYPNAFIKDKNGNKLFLIKAKL